MHILPPVTAEGFDGSHHQRFADCGISQLIQVFSTEQNLKCKTKYTNSMFSLSDLKFFLEKGQHNSVELLH